MKKELLTRFMEKRIVELKKEQRNGTAHVYQSTLNRLKNFMNGREITFSQLTPEWLALFEQKLLADQLKWNTISTYMRMLRSVYIRLWNGAWQLTCHVFSIKYIPVLIAR